jgi:hypothetical protein
MSSSLHLMMQRDQLQQQSWKGLVTKKRLHCLHANATVNDVSDESMSTSPTSGMTGMCQQEHSQPSLRHKLSAYLAVLDEQHSASDDAEGPVAAAELERPGDYNLPALTQ